jgi:hypothetical protein
MFMVLETSHHIQIKSDAYCIKLAVRSHYKGAELIL